MTIQERNDEFKTVYELVNDSNIIEVEVSNFTSQQLSENFITNISFVTLNGIRHDQNKKLVKKGTTCTQMIESALDLFKEQISVTDATSLQEYNKMSRVLDADDEDIEPDNHFIKLK